MKDQASSKAGVTGRGSPDIAYHFSKTGAESFVISMWKDKKYMERGLKIKD